MMNVSDDRFLQASVNKSINRLEDYRVKVKALEGDIVSDISATLRGWEGVASKIYFDTINLFLPEQYRFEKGHSILRWMSRTLC